MNDYKPGADVYSPHFKIHGIVKGVFYYDDIQRKDIKKLLNFDIEILNKNLPYWKKKPIYLIISYDDETDGEWFVALHDSLILTGEMN